MERRDFLMSAVAMATVAAAGSAIAEDKMDMGNMDMGGMHMHHHSNSHAKLIAAASDCVLKANLCLQHCIG